MTTRARRRRVVLIVTALAVLLLVGWLAHSLGVVVQQTRNVAVPRDDASAATVVRAYVAALDSHDCVAARRLSVDRAATDVWCRDVLSLTNLKLRPSLREKPEWSGHRRGQQVMAVPVSFDLRWRLFHNDGSMAQGRTVWGYLLVRNSARDPWRIADEGTG